MHRGEFVGFYVTKMWGADTSPHRAVGPLKGFATPIEVLSALPLFLDVSKHCDCDVTS